MLANFVYQFAVLSALATPVASWQSTRQQLQQAPFRAADRSHEFSSRTTTVPIRFINTPSGKDVTTEAVEGDILLYAAEKAGVFISRGCKTGLCGACTADLKDASWTEEAHLLAGNEDGRAGFQTVRTCSTRTQLLPGQNELIVDVFRTKGDEKDSATERDADPMARFSDGWEEDFVPDYKSKLKSDVPETLTAPTPDSGVAPWDKIW